jgi:hypothetical protein
VNGIPPINMNLLYEIYHGGDPVSWTSGMPKKESIKKRVMARLSYQVDNANRMFYFGKGTSYNESNKDLWYLNAYYKSMFPARSSLFKHTTSDLACLD